MKILIVAATRDEIKQLEEHLLFLDSKQLLKQHAIELVITGAGSVLTAFHLGKMLHTDNWDLAVNLGICGSFNKELPIGTVVNIISDVFGDLGAADGENFLDAFEIGLLEADKFPFSNGRIINPHNSVYPAIESLPKVSSITVNTVSGNEKSINQLKAKFQADVESMEGAAFMYCCMKESVRFVQIRCISNYVQKRDKSTWNIELAIKNLNTAAIKLIEESLLTIHH